MKHLSDAELQAYLDREASISREEMEAHLHACAHCRSNLAAYRRLYGGLKDETGFLLSANFADAVAARIEKRGERKADLLELSLIVTALISGLAAVLYFFDPGAVFKNLLQQGVAGISGLMRGIPLLQGSSLHILLFTAAILALVGILDKMIFQFRQR